MLIVKNLDKLKEHGFKYNDGSWGLYYDYDCGDNRTYIYVEVPSGIVTVVPSLYGDCPAEKYDNQLDIIAKLVIDGVIELKFIEPYGEEKSK